MKYSFALIVLFSFGVGLSFAQKSPAFSGDVILKNIEANFSGIQDYTVSLEVTVDLERLKVPKMVATMYFKQPNKTRFVSEGFALLPREGLSFTPGSLQSRFVVEGVKRDSVLFMLTLKPLNDRTQLRKVFLTIDSTNWTVTRMTTPQFDGRRMNAQFEYRKVEGHWLPAVLTVAFTSDSAEADTPDPFGQFPTAPRPSQIPRTGTIVIRYLDYTLNTGLKDEFFEQENDKAPR